MNRQTEQHSYPSTIIQIGDENSKNIQLVKDKEKLSRRRRHKQCNMAGQWP